MALSCPLLHASLDISSLHKFWGVCQEILSQIARLNTSVRKWLELLDKFYSLTCSGPSESSLFSLAMHTFRLTWSRGPLSHRRLVCHLR